MRQKAIDLIDKNTRCEYKKNQLLISHDYKKLNFDKEVFN